MVGPAPSGSVQLGSVWLGPHRSGLVLARSGSVRPISNPAWRTLQIEAYVGVAFVQNAPRDPWTACKIEVQNRFSRYFRLLGVPAASWGVQGVWASPGESDYHKFVGFLTKSNQCSLIFINSYQISSVLNLIDFQRFGPVLA